MPTPWDLTTREGIDACITESFLPKFKQSFEEDQYFGITAVVFMTRHESRTLPRPETLVVLSAEEATEFLPKVYRMALHDCHATGVLTAGITWAAAFESLDEWLAWKGRPLTDHPRCFRALSATLEHRTFGIKSWQGRIEDRDGRGVVGPFELQNVARPDDGFLDYVQTMS